MRFLVTASTTFAISLISVLTAMLVNRRLGVAQVQPWIALCIAVGMGLAFGAQAQWQLSRSTGGILVGLLGGLSCFIGMWLSAHA